MGYDLSPLAVMASNTKITSYIPERLEAIWKKLKFSLPTTGVYSLSRSYPELVHKALPEGRLEKLDTISRFIERIEGSNSEKDFFRLALISVIPCFSHAVANGGWLRWLNQGARAEKVILTFECQVEMMMSDICAISSQSNCHCEAQIADARAMPAPDGTYSAVITSPPYLTVTTTHAFLVWNSCLHSTTGKPIDHSGIRPSIPTRKPDQIGP